MKIEKKYRIPKESFLNQNKNNFDFVETYSIMINNCIIKSDELLSSFFSSIPNWFKWILKINEKREYLNRSPFKFSEGNRIGLFHIFRIFNKEVIIGINSKHLDYRVALLIQENSNMRIVIGFMITRNSVYGNIQFIILKTIQRQIAIKFLKNISKSIN